MEERSRRDVEDAQNVTALLQRLKVRANLVGDESYPHITGLAKALKTTLQPSDSREFVESPRA